MRIFGWALATLVAAFVSPLFAQSAFEGPLAAPGAPATVPAAQPKHAKPKKARHAAAKPAAVDAFDAPAAAAEPAPPTPRSAAEDPLSLGMKWNGNNDSVAQTRSQNLDGNAFGSGAEVGMKLHF